MIADTTTAIVFAPAPQSLVHAVTAAAVFGPCNTTLPSPHPSNFTTGTYKHDVVIVRLTDHVTNFTTEIDFLFQ